MGDTDQERPPQKFGDEEVSRRYRALAAERPPEDLDRKIRAAARKSGWARSWQRPLAIAATLALGVGLVLEMAEPPGISGESALRPAPEARRMQPAGSGADRESPGSPAGPAAISRFTAPRESTSQPDVVTRPGLTTGMATKSRPESSDKQYLTSESPCAEHHQAPDSWLECIESLEADGEAEAVAAERRAFAERYPDVAASPD